ncbi:MAG: hypothetical protein GOV15_03495 [Candidatus Diapherotrites archaeon]|nr:hypothetical protein [Candidatus Diapherotrites archaeon]
MNELFDSLGADFLHKVEKYDPAEADKIESLHKKLHRSINRELKVARSISENDDMFENKDNVLEGLLDAKQEALLFTHETLGDESKWGQIESVDEELRLLRARRIGAEHLFEEE